jgi:hypothetical protein
MFSNFIYFSYFVLKKTRNKSKTWPLTTNKKKIMGLSFFIKLHLYLTGNTLWVKISYIDLPFLKIDNPYKNEPQILKRGNNSNIKLSILYLCLQIYFFQHSFSNFIYFSYFVLKKTRNKSKTWPLTTNKKKIMGLSCWK